MIFTYTNEDGYTCNGEIEIVKAADPMEVNVAINGMCVFIIVGSYISGHFICIPEWSAGSALSRLDDYRWNYERLSRCPQLTKDRIAAITNALALIKKIFKRNTHKK